MGDLLGRFEREMAQCVEVLHTAATTLQSSTEELGAAAARASAQSVSAATVSESTATKVGSAADAGEGLAQTISEVGANAAQSSQLANAAVGEAELTSTTIDELASVAAGDRQGDRPHQRDCRADQSPGAQRHHRGGARRRGRPRLRRGRPGGEGAGRADRQGDGGDRRR